MKFGEENVKIKACEIRLRNKVLSQWRGLEAWVVHEWKEYVHQMKLCRKIMNKMIERS
jgi:hypothetical protein